MNETKMSALNGGLLWLGAAISIAEIITGTLLAPLGFLNGLIVIVIGHLIGCVMFYYVGLIGAERKMSAMESVSMSFGGMGSKFFALFNILQLVGWTAVMISSATHSLGSVLHIGQFNNLILSLIIGVLIAIWIILGIKNLGKLNTLAVVILFGLMVLLGIIVFQGNHHFTETSSMSFGLGLELAIAMPISWLPLIADYTKHTEKPVSFSLVSTIGYFVGSCFMYIIGLGAAIFTNQSDISKILLQVGLGIPAILIIVLSTVTTTFLNVHSAGESLAHFSKKISSKQYSILVCAVGTVIAIFIPIEQYENFLYFIGSVFVPMATILITDYFILKNNKIHSSFNIPNAILWIVGFVIYRIFLGIDTVLGSTIPVVLIIMLLCILYNYISKKVVKKHV